MGFQLARLAATGFRGINRALDLELSAGLTVVVGPNGAGKSSLLQAIEWALFGTLPEGGHAEFRREDAVVNAFSSQSRARVRLTLSDGKRTLNVERTRTLGRSTTARSELVVRADGQVWRDAAGQEALERILRLTVAEFHSAVMLRQDASRLLAGAEHEERAATIDRLLGIAALRELSDNFIVSQVSREVNRVARELDAQRAGGLTTTLELRRLLSQREDALAARRISAARLGARGLESLLTELESGLAQVTTVLKLPPGDRPATPAARLAELQRRLPVAARQREEALRRTYEQRSQLAVALARLESAAQAADGGDLLPSERPGDIQADLAGIEEGLADLRGRRDRWERLQRERTDLGAALAAAQDQLRALTARREANEDADALDRLQRELAAVTAEGKQQGAQARLVGDALEALEGADPEQCPVCGQPIDPAALRRHLQAEVATNRDLGRLAQLRLRYRRLDDQRRRLQEAARELETARATVERRQGDLASVNGAIAALLTADPATANAQSTGPGAPFERRVAALEEERQALRDAVRQQEQERQRRHARGAQQRAAIESVARILDVPVDVPTADLLERAQQRQGALTDELAGLEAAGSRLTALEAAAQEAAAIFDYIDLKANVERLESGRPEAEQRLGALQKTHARLVRLQSGLQAIHSAAAELGEARLQRALDTVLPLANRYFDRLGGHPTYSALTLQPQMQRGASIYALLAHDSDLEHATFLPTRLSHTQIHVAALAIFLALAAQPLHRLDLLLLDDPAQSMDAERRRALATALAQEESDRQMLVTTEDGAFGEQLRTAAQGPARIVPLGSWDSGGVRLDG